MQCKRMNAECLATTQLFQFFSSCVEDVSSSPKSAVFVRYLKQFVDMSEERGGAGLTMISWPIRLYCRVQ